jgi:hypothetical protein
MARRPEIERVPTVIREILIERLEVATFAGSLELTLVQMAGVLHALFPEDFREPRNTPQPSDTPPRSEGRIEVYERRVAAKQTLHHPGDAKPDNDRIGMRTSWSNGRGAMTTGWTDGIEPPDDEADPLDN